MKTLSIRIVALLVTLGATLLAACAPSQPLTMAPMADMPAMVQAAPETTQQAYRFAAANRSVLQQIACYCGCYKTGHKSNYDCYVRGVSETGAVDYNDHAINCKVCVDITQDVMTRLQQGESPTDIQAYIDRGYSHYGPPTNLSGAEAATI